MATTAVPARTAAQAATQLISRSTAKGHKARASLIYDMHSQLYPHLYKGGKPKLSLGKQTSSIRRNAPESTPYFASKKEWKKSYSDEKLEAARKHTQGLQVFAPKPPMQKKCPDPVSVISSSQITALDPSGARTRLFLKSNPEAARVGDILLVRQRTGEPFAGVCINIRRRGVDTAILLRGQLTRVGVEMWFKVYSPLVEGIEVVQRAAKRARRARLTYMREVKHDRGDVNNLVRGYLARKASLGGAEGGKKGMGGGAHKGKKAGKGRGKKR